ncbi:MAG: MFS transporter [Bacteroidales bacterium]
MVKTEGNNRIIALLFVGVLMGALDISIVGPALPSIETAIKVDDRFSGWIFSIYVLFNLVGISLFARLSDIYGRRRIYVLAVSIFAAGSLWVSLSQNFNLLLIGRAVQGFGASGIFPVASALVGDLFPPEKRGRVLGMIGAVFGLAFLMGPFMAGVMLHYFSWNFLFIINLPISAVIIYYSFRILPATTSTVVSSIDWWGIITMGSALAALTFGLNNLDTLKSVSSSGNTMVILPFIISIISFLLLIVAEKRAENPIVKLEFFSNNQIRIVGAIAIVTGMVQSCFVYIPKYVVTSFSVEPSVASFMLTPFVLATAIGSPIFGRLIDRYGVKRIIIAGLILTAAGFFILPRTAGHRLLFYTSGVLVGLGLSVLAGSSLRYIMLNNTDINDRAVSQGMITIFTSVGQLTGTALVGLMLGSMIAAKAFNLLFLGVSMVLLILVPFSFGIRRSVPSQQVPDNN